MQNAILKLESGEIVLGEAITTIGRITENTVSFPADSNVSRYHAELEIRGGDHYLIDLGSSNGTTVNDNALNGSIRLKSGDRIVFGGSSTAEFVIADGETQDQPIATDTGSAGSPEAVRVGDAIASEAGYAANNAIYGAMSGVSSGAGSAGTAAASAAPAASAGSSSTVLIAGAVVGVAVISVVAAGAFYMTRGSACAATASIVKPETGDSINAPTDIELKIENGACVKRAVFTIDGEEAATANAPSFEVTLDPKDFPELADGTDHNLQLVLIDENGERIPQASAVMLAFETRAVAKPPPTPIVANAATPAKTTAAGAVTLLAVQDMAQRLVKQFSGNFSYNVTNKQFLQEVQKRAAEFAQEGYSQRAAAYRDAINLAFVREQNLDAPFGFMLAMSRSKFNAAKQGEEEGLWRMTNAFVNDNKYNGQCGTETLSDPLQNCAAKAAAIYMKAVVYGVFEGDHVYSAAAFGKSPQDAGVWKASLPANRSEIWNVIKTPAEREQILRFFAAGIVAENPQKFGLAKDRPLSELYRVTM